MKKIIFGTLLFAPFAAMAQMDMPKKMQNDSSITISIYRNIGASFQKFDNLNARVKNYPQYKAIPDVIGTLGIGSVVHRGHLVGVNSFTVGYAMNGNRQKKNGTLGFLGISGDVGYDFFGKGSRLQLYPTVGLGLEGYRARYNKDVSDVSFNDVLGSNTQQNIIRSLTFYNLYFNYRVGLNLGVKSKDGTGTIGLQGGYTGSFTDVAWKVNYNQLLQNSPSDNLSRFFINLYMAKDLKWGHHKMM